MGQDKAQPLVCRRLSCGFHNHVVLRDVSFEADPGTVTAVLGANGAGKSTLLSTVGGFLPSLAGSAQLGSREIKNLPPRERARQIAFVPQQELTDFDFSAIEVVAMGRIAASNGLFETREDVDISEQALAQVDGSHLADRRFRELSGGERQRVLIARALAQQTQVLLLDEPTSHLDLAHQITAIELLHFLAAEGKTILVAVHDLNWAKAAASHAVLLSEGECTYSGPMDVLLRDQKLEAAYGAPLMPVRGSDGAEYLLPQYPRP